MNLAKEAKDLLKENKKTLMREIRAGEMAQGSKGAYHQACVLESDSWTLQVRP